MPFPWELAPVWRGGLCQHPLWEPGRPVSAHQCCSPLLEISCAIKVDLGCGVPEWRVSVQHAPVPSGHPDPSTCCENLAG